jgi:magnesium-transporting ATPase (P-type)
VWVLTGDKIETAINIGYSAGLLNNDMEQVVIKIASTREILRQLKEIKRRKAVNSQTTKKQALVIAGEALTQV